MLNSSLIYIGNCGYPAEPYTCTSRLKYPYVKFRFTILGNIFDCSNPLGLL
ncbi:hypothetical protein CBFG_00775 [Clostridiales bacterium 1_7_47FAA]|nr:hypothetical protein CBFG_00775 [Clostridiales bacterium 1_7_47FAA]